MSGCGSMSGTSITGTTRSSESSAITRATARIPDTQACSGRFSSCCLRQAFSSLLSVPDQMGVAAGARSGSGDFLYQSSIRLKHGSDGALVLGIIPVLFGNQGCAVPFAADGTALAALDRVKTAISTAFAFEGLDLSAVLIGFAHADPAAVLAD